MELDTFELGVKRPNCQTFLPCLLTLSPSLPLSPAGSPELRLCSCPTPASSSTPSSTCWERVENQRAPPRPRPPACLPWWGPWEPRWPPPSHRAPGPAARQTASTSPCTHVSPSAWGAGVPGGEGGGRKVVRSRVWTEG